MVNSLTIPELPEIESPSDSAMIVVDTGTETKRVSKKNFGRSLSMAPPVGAIIPFHPGYYTGAANAGFTLVGPATNTIADVNTWLGGTWRVCDGTEHFDVDSPIFNVAGRFLPNLTDSRFVRGSTTVGGAANPTTTPTFTGTPVAYSTWAAAGNYQPAGTNSGGAATFNKNVMNTNQTAHSHGAGTYYACIQYAGASYYARGGAAGTTWTSTGVWPITAGTASSTSRSEGINVVGSSSTASVSWSSVNVSTSFTDSDFLGTAVARSTFFVAGNYTPAGTIGALTTEPKYLNVLYITRVK